MYPTGTSDSLSKYKRKEGYSTDTSWASITRTVNYPNHRHLNKAVTMHLVIIGY